MHEAGPADHPIVVFDGVCGFCNRLVLFALRRDRAGKLRFASNRSAVAQRLLAEHGLSGIDSETAVVLVGGRGLLRSDAILFIVGSLAFPYSLVRILRVVPRPIRDFAYKVVSRRRRRIFGEVPECSLIPAEFRERVLGD